MQPGTKKVLSLVVTITATIFIGSYFYYDSINKSEDPRTLPAKELFLKYDKELESDEYVQALSMLDQMLAIYRATPGYEKSYEIGVLLNNKATVYLVELETEILTKEDVTKETLDTPLAVAADYTNEAIAIYENWMKDMGSLSEEQIKERISPYFKADDPAFGDMNVNKLLKKRVNLIVDAQLETPRRLSVSLTNLGMINRYLGNLEEAKANYEKAIELWDRNYTAQDNLAILHNQPVKKRSMLSRLFPPEKDAENKDKPN
jgi:tetratricopeptide (TPR) repeat protein